MMARPAGDIFAEIVEQAGRLAKFQRVLNDLPSPGARKAAVMEALCVGLLSRDETTILFEIYELANA